MPNKNKLSFTANFYAPDSVPTEVNQNIQDAETMIQSYLFVESILNAIYYLNLNVESFEENDSAVMDKIDCTKNLAQIGLVFADKMHELFSELLPDERAESANSTGTLNTANLTIGGEDEE